MIYIFKRTKRLKSNGKMSTTESVMVKVTAVYRNINKYKQYPSTVRIEVLDNDKDLIYYYDADANIEEIYNAHGDLVDDKLEMGR